MPPKKAMHVRTSFADLDRMPDDGRRYELYDARCAVFSGFTRTFDRYWVVDPANRSIDRYELIDDGYALVQSASVIPISSLFD